MIQLQIKPANHLISAYNQMMKKMRDAFENTEPSDMSLQKALELAKHQAVHLGEVSAEEAHEIGEYIKRDINDAAEYMMETSSEFYDWLMLDIEIIERKVIDLFLSVADQTRIELEQFSQAKPKNKSF
jgi:zinc ribbon family protein